MSAALLLDLSHTSHTRARTGIQRVARSLYRELGDAAVAVTWDPYLGGWRGLERWELANLAAAAPATKRGAHWPAVARFRGRLRRLTAGIRATRLPISADGLLVPELFSPGVAAALPDLFAATRGPRVALFHDAIALQAPELSPSKTVARCPAYLQELLAFDGIAAVSEDSRTTLIDYWQWLGAPDTPPVVTLSLGIDAAPTVEDGRTGQAARPIVLSVGSIEGRKNHVALLDACEALWSRGASFELSLIGLAQAETGRAALCRIRALQSAGRPVRFEGPAGDAEIEQAYAACDFTVYPSLREGFGLPVLESLRHGKPCVCSGGGALGEAARGGGCLTLERVDAASLEGAIDRLLGDRTELARLATEARRRTFRGWTGYVADLTRWMSGLPRRRR